MAEIILMTGDAPSTPSTNRVTIYSKTDKLVYMKDDTGAETALTNIPGGSVSLFQVLTAAFYRG